MKATKKQFILIQIGKELKWCEVMNKRTGTYYIEIVMDWTNERMGWQCQESDILAVSDINVTVLQKNIELGIK